MRETPVFKGTRIPVDLAKTQDAHDRRECRDANGAEAWACDRYCTERVERKLASTGGHFWQASPCDGSVANSESEEATMYAAGGSYAATPKMVWMNSRCATASPLATQRT